MLQTVKLRPVVPFITVITNNAMGLRVAGATLYDRRYPALPSSAQGGRQAAGKRLIVSVGIWSVGSVFLEFPSYTNCL